VHESRRSITVALVAEELGARDVFVFRRIAGGRLAHVGGVGRGEGWAGIVDLGTDEDTIVRRALEGFRPAHVSSADPRNVFGPYYARSAVAVPVPPDTIVVFGHPEHALADRSDDALRERATQVAALIEHVSPAKRLADELEVLEALRSLADGPTEDLDATLQHVAATAAHALSCELGVVYLREPERVAVANRGWPVDADTELVLDAMRGLSPRSDDCPLCVQDTSRGPLPRPFGHEAGVRSFYLLELGPPAPGLLLLMHTESAPRGFTNLCRELGLRLVAAASPFIATAVQRESLRNELERLNATARRDALTGVANRLAWEEAVASAQRRTDQGEPTSVVMLDLDGLKQTNDARGHAVGDDLLRALSGAVHASIRDRDTVARLGGDELAVLLPGTDEPACAEVVERISLAIETHPGVSGVPLSAAVGWATCLVGESVDRAVDLADQRMYERKAGRTQRRLSA
jgi:diguanylate cyclase (GGDEF)-like protein